MRKDYLHRLSSSSGNKEVLLLLIKIVFVRIIFNTFCNPVKLQPHGLCRITFTFMFSNISIKYRPYIMRLKSGPILILFAISLSHYIYIYIASNHEVFLINN